MFIVLGISNDGEVFVGFDSNLEKSKQLCSDKQLSGIGEYVNFNVYQLEEGEIFSDLSPDCKTKRIVY